jgi:hypothetical protein
MNVSSPRTDDINRVYHTFRYDVLKPTSFKRIAFYQLGADHYNSPTEKIAYGNETGLNDEWLAERGERRYYRTNVPAPGRIPWFSLHNPIKIDDHPGPSANRGLIIREWKARIAGQKAPLHFSIFGTEQGRAASANIELSPPPGCTQLLPGDFIEAKVELVVLPAAADDYYGPNEALRTSLQTLANPWQSIHRQAIGNDVVIKATEGKLISRYPPVIAATSRDTAEFQISAGLAYLPVTIEGLNQHDNFQLSEFDSGSWRPIDQSVHGNDFWQTTFDPSTKWSRTYNLFLDQKGDSPRRFRLERIAHQ